MNRVNCERRQLAKYKNVYEVVRRSLKKECAQS